MPLNLHLLRLFTHVAESGSFSAAAERLHISQPAVSKGVREFEAQVGSRLLERGPGGVVPTGAGEMLLRHAAMLFATERAAEEDLAALRGLTKGSLTVGASTTIATYFLPPLLGRFHRAHPHIDLSIRIANTSAIANLLLARELDIALVEGPVEDSAIEARPWRVDELIVIAPPGHRLTYGTHKAAALADEVFIVREPGSGTREVVWAALAEHHVTPRATLEAGNTETIKQIVMAGLGIGIVSRAAAADHLTLGRLVKIDIEGFQVSRTLTRLSLRGRQPSAAAKAFEILLDPPRKQSKR
ncbi:LysR substrate-binding domain-containing protein [Methylovirgula sp. 4M-Z18]|uniref:LysR substrate-binding domain-containing protein n=1 Tax=Methylovirgula sp. 4M-Z18 TaxID=2293567 RepID=UPI000E2EB1DE|nr:LysR substrate-binding domain-containing protein [Methylovirgula sp. 4M-Z18]RFB79648.1 LysR family transcriptional regulator [Methylovirgula sp. 4M-Z18]